MYDSEKSPDFRIYRLTYKDILRKELCQPEEYHGILKYPQIACELVINLVTQFQGELCCPWFENDHMPEELPQASATLVHRASPDRRPK